MRYLNLEYPKNAIPLGEYLEIIVDEAEEWLKHSGSLVLEMAPHHVDAISERMLGRGYSDVQIFQDLSGRNRGVVGKWN